MLPVSPRPLNPQLPGHRPLERILRVVVALCDDQQPRMQLPRPLASRPAGPSGRTSPGPWRGRPRPASRSARLERGDNDSGGVPALAVRPRDSVTPLPAAGTANSREVYCPGSPCRRGGSRQGPGRGPRARCPARRQAGDPAWSTPGTRIPPVRMDQDRRRDPRDRRQLLPPINDSAH
jgi:hypothetical protein